MAVVAALTMLVACSSSASKHPTTFSAADAGFRPDKNGFAFQNYGELLADGSAPTNLTTDDVRMMFGDAVCVNAKSGKCDLIPEAVAWRDSTNEQMAGGHCFGFAVAAELLWQGKIDPTTLGAPGAAALDISANNALQRVLAYDWALQLLDSVWNARTTGSPNQILAKLDDVLVPHPTELYTLTLYKPDFSGGHAVTPFAVQDKGGGKYDVLIYDNNWPKQTRAISFDTNTNTWTYDAAVNPDQPAEMYSGDAKSETIQLLPTSPGVGTQPCPFCEKQKASTSRAANAVGGTKTAEIYMKGGLRSHARMLITDGAGHRLGYVGGRLVQEISGARVEHIVANNNSMDDPPPVFFVPVPGKYTITIDGAKLAADDSETIGVIGPSYAVSVDGIMVKPGERDTLTLDSVATALTYTSSRAESPTIELSRSDERADYSFKVTGLVDEPGSTLAISDPPDGKGLLIRDIGVQASSTVRLEMTRYADDGIQTFSHEGITQAGEDTAELQYRNWTDTDQGIPLVTTHGGQRSTHLLTNHGSG